MGPKKNKRKSKKQLKEEELLAERQKKEEAEQRAREEEARKQELEKLRIEAKLKAKTELAEQHVREDILARICKIFAKARKYGFKAKIQQRDLEEWVRYVKCDRLPYPESVPNLHTHLFLWKSNEESVSMEQATDRAETMLRILDVLNDLINEPLNVKPQTVLNWKEARECYRREMTHKINLATFNLIRDIENSMNRIDFWTVDYKKVTSNITIGMWGWLEEPVSETDKRAPPCVDFKECGVIVRLPVPYNKKFVVIRAIRTLYDHLSDTSKTFNEPSFTFEFNLTTLVSRWYEARETLKREQEKLEAENKKIEDQLKQENETLLVAEVLETSTTASISDETEDKAVEGEVDLHKEDTKSPSPEPLNQIILPERQYLIYLEDDTETDDQVLGTHEDDTRVDTKGSDKYSTDDDFFLKLVCPSDPFPGHPEVRSLFELVRDFDRAAADEEQRLHENKNIKKCLETLYDINIPENVTDGKPQLHQVKDPNDIIEERNKKKWNDFIISMETNNVSFHELNLRKCVILGGVYFIELMNHVPQSVILKNGANVRIQYGDYDIQRDEFFFKYEPPKIVETKEDEEEKPPPDDNIDRLINLEITLPQHVLWFEAPTIYQWNSEDKIWSNEHVYDVRFNEEKQVISFRIGKTDPIGLAAVRYNNLPFQTWELRPDWRDRSCIVLSLTASTVILEFLIQGKKVALQCLQNATGTALEPIIGEFYFPKDLVKEMKRAGVDLFPCYDTFLYVEGNAVKLAEIEEHIYLSMAMFANTYQFTWSRWNLPAGKGKLVFQMREALEKQNLPSYQMVMSNLYRTVIVNCSEVTPAFSDESKPEYGFYPDLYSLLSSISSPKAASFANEMSIDLILTVYQMLMYTKVMSFS